MLGYVDLDEVLVDYTTQALYAHGRTLEPLPMLYNLGLEDDAAYWQPIERMGEEFWLDIQPFDWADDVLHLVKQCVDEWYILTKPGNFLASYTGKLKWLWNYFGEDFQRCTVTRKPKCRMANPNALLIDDHEDNVRQFVECGGNAILFPSRYNRLYKIWDDPVPYLKDQLEPYQCT